MKVISVFGSSSTPPGSDGWRGAETLGRLLAEGGYAVATGGYGGSMAAVSKGAAEAGGRVIGVTAPDVFKGRPGANRHVTEEIRAPHLLERIHRLTDMSAASIALPGSLGTLTEIMVAWNLAYVAPFAEADAKPLIVVGPRWAEIVSSLADGLGVGLNLVHAVGSVEDAVVTLERVAAPGT